MPHFKESSSSSASDGGLEYSFGIDSQGIVDDATYASRLSSNTETPLSQQLDPIAVIGMGMSKLALSFHTR